MRPFPLVIFLLYAFSWVGTICAQTEIEKLTAESMPAIQAQIRAMVSALSGRRSDTEIKTNGKGFRELATLKELANKEEIVKQLAIYAVVEQRVEDQQVLEARLVLHFLDFKPIIPIRVLAPYLDTGNPQLGEFVRDWFESHDDRETDVLSRQTVNYQDYLEYVLRKRNKNQEVPTAFIKYIYERSPDQALKVFYRIAQQDATIAKLMEMQKQQEAHQREREKNGDAAAELLEVRKRWAAFHRKLRKNGQDPLPIEPLPPLPPPVVPNLPDMITRPLEKRPQKEILLVEHIVSNAIWLKKNKFDERFQKVLPKAKEELSNLVKYDQWWVRLYVAEIMRRNRELWRSSVTIATLWSASRQSQ